LAADYRRTLPTYTQKSGIIEAAVLDDILNR
jgi:hypothetical protein